MKKVLTFILAAAMAVGMATSAMAYKTGEVKLTAGVGGGSVDADSITTGSAVTAALPAGASWDGTTLSGVDLSMFATGDRDKVDVNFRSQTDSIPDDFNITASVKKGSDVVKATVKKDDQKVEIKVIPNYAWSTTKQADYKVEIKFAAKKSSHMTSKTITITGIVSANGQWDTVKDMKEVEDFTVPSAETNSSYIVKWGGTPTEDVTVTFGDFDDDMDVYMFFTRIVDQGAINLYHDDEPDGYKDIRKANIDADIDFVNFPARPVFDIAGKLVIGADRDSYIYEIVSGNANALSVNGAYRADANISLVKGNFTWDDSEGGWSKRTNKLTAYVISDKELEVTSFAGSGSSTTGTGTGTVTNPGTGANDMVNVAVALAVVSLAAAGAVAFKRASK